MIIRQQDDTPASWDICYSHNLPQKSSCHVSALCKLWKSLPARNKLIGFCWCVLLFLDNLCQLRLVYPISSPAYGKTTSKWDFQTEIQRSLRARCHSSLPDLNIYTYLRVSEKSYQWWLWSNTLWVKKEQQISLQLLWMDSFFILIDS